ncbi:2-amino-4-hydroxy-6-hydroxymethyldihydropteridinediphosphokinase [Selenihalanaerobacter shriftii]|uniref:2-amino-4-hydroxy-6-hydroxymethyldihydropteridine diphosphokinase n=2 Tax=Selenihalanaerobacter shriftii TaxID=142842 RepID=A0A1T4P5V5_9FIRM|nr:2-amino-4-hydroxy-6-hydroxymethyldihydropteridine diphosphokinase [Selenihalanaerobacter shriftii]SJZ86626.1 2-amino-4-hydroxy-6-hydroxymethyldihydropteridinediphosphokinase [Selenihalanaerobacter shriftii]
MEAVYLSLGSNLGDREEYLKEAISKLGQHIQIKVDTVSSVYKTEPVGYTNQDEFLNLVVKIKTSLSPMELLNHIQEVEKNLDRVRDIRWGPRTIDIDIILFGKNKVNSQRLTIPHPRFHERAFVLVPLAELTDDVLYQGKTANQLLDQLTKDKGVKKYPVGV